MSSFKLKKKTYLQLTLSFGTAFGLEPSIDEGVLTFSFLGDPDTSYNKLFVISSLIEEEEIFYQHRIFYQYLDSWMYIRKLLWIVKCSFCEIYSQRYFPDKILPLPSLLKSNIKPNFEWVFLICSKFHTLQERTVTFFSSWKELQGLLKWVNPLFDHFQNTKRRHSQPKEL